MKRRLFGMGVVLLVAGLIVGAVSGVTAAPSDKQLVNLELTDVDAQAAIRMLFQSTGHNYSIGPDVTGTIPSVSFKEVEFDQALKTLLKSAGLVYRIDGDSNIYIISKKAAVAAPTTPAPSELVPVDTTAAEETTIEKVKLNNVGASEILQMMGSGGTSGTNQGFGNYGTFGNSSMMGGSMGNSGGNFGGSSRNSGGGSYGGGSSRSYGGSSGSSYGGGSNRSW